MSFIPIAPNMNEKCCICLEPLIEDCWSHKKLHLAHKECLVTWLKTRPNCPICNAKINTTSIIGYKFKPTWPKHNFYRRLITADYGELVTRAFIAAPIALLALYGIAALIHDIAKDVLPIIPGLVILGTGIFLHRIIYDINYFAD